MRLITNKGLTPEPPLSPHEIAASCRFRQDIGPCGPVPTEKRFLINWY